MVITNGAEINRFLEDEIVWQKSAWCEDHKFQVNGMSVIMEDLVTVKNTDQVKMVSGTFFRDDTDKEGTPLEEVFRHWRKTANYSYLVVEVPNDRAAIVAQEIRGMGLRVEM